MSPKYLAVRLQKRPDVNYMTIRETEREGWFYTNPQKTIKHSEQFLNKKLLVL